MTEKTVAKKRLSKKALIAEICEATGKAPKELDSLVIDLVGNFAHARVPLY